MNVELVVSGVDDVGDVGELHEWLRKERALAGLVRRVPQPIEDGHLGGVADILVVALGAGGAGAVLAQSLLTWLRSRRADVSVTVSTEVGVVKVAATNLASADVLPVLERVLQARDG
ncbi:effector-associated constant component EACC1 [Dactylosporangium sp. CA-233914]|uniref:effector-associated constant component EACC1 n=1 Tax=Dactylosporangium sp. CA-233914 TaxID=3239934 RepID=UPI003D8B3C50